jgi:hypothetical protein
MKKFIRVTIELLEHQDNREGQLNSLRTLSTAAGLLELKGQDRGDIQDTVQRLASNGLEIVLRGT